jgi:outer membrane protein, heavy metal efflux system
MYVRHWLACVLAAAITLTGASRAMAEATSADVPYGKPSVGATLTLNRALSLALANNPELSVSSFEVQAREARIIQSSAFPNPHFEAEIDNIYGNKELRNFTGAETSVSLSQLIELGGKRQKRTAVAALERDLSQWDREAKKLDLQAEVTKAFIDVVGEQERVVLFERLFHIAEQSLVTVAARVQSGKVSPIDETKATASLSSVAIELEKAKRSLEAARTRLAYFWGGSGSSFARVEDTTAVDPGVPPLDELSKSLMNNPDVARWESEIKQRNASLDLEKAIRIPDPSLRGGVKYFNETSERAILIGISIPLPLFNVNKGAVIEAGKRVSKAEEEKKAAVLKVQSALSAAYLALTGTNAEATALKNKVLPALQDAYDAVSEGYRHGKFGYLDLLDSQRTLFEARIKYREAVVTYRKAKADVLRLTGSGPKTLPMEGEKYEN